jgi:uncharacterized protein (DUF362 family)
MTEVRSESLAGLDDGAIRRGLEVLLGDHRERLDRADRVLLLPDAHYPYHRSTGLVTNPAVVGELASLLDAPVAIGVPAGQHIDAERVGTYLGLERIADRCGAELLDLGESKRIERRVRFVDGTVTLAVPDPLAQDSVVVVPTARRDPHVGVAAGMVTLANAVTTDPTHEELLAAVRLCWPTLAVLDATYTYPGEPRRRGLLAADDDVVALSRSAAAEVGVDPVDVPHLGPRRTPPSPRALLSTSGSTERESRGDGLLETGYRAYARLTGDLLPPQMLPRGEEE